MQSIRLLVIVFTGTVILCGALFSGCGDSSSGGSSAQNNLSCTFTNVQSLAQCNNLSAGNSCQNLPAYDASTGTCNTNACLFCSG
jgi:hypothetical protein